MFGLRNVDTQKALLRITILGLISILAFSSRLFSVIRYESIIHEFDPWFNFRATKYLVENGFYKFLNWFDALAWYPLGRVVGGTVYPGLMVTASFIHEALRTPFLLHFHLDIREICVFLAPLFSAFTAVAAYLFTAEVKDSAAGLFAALFMGVAPGYISRSVAGSYDNEGIAIFLLLFTFYLWIRAIKTGSAFFGALTALFYFYMVSAWGGYVFITNLVPLHVFALLIMGRYSSKVYISYCTFYALGTLLSMQIPFVGFQPIRTSEHMAALGVFGLLQLVAFADFVRGYVKSSQFSIILKGSIVVLFVVMFGGLIALTAAGFIAPWNGRFYSLFDTGYAKKYIPIIASVSEHQPTPWSSLFFDLHILIVLFPAGVYFCFRELRDEHVFVILYSIFASYFAGVMVRLILTLTPVVCIAAAIAASKLYDLYLYVQDEPSDPPSPSEKKDGNAGDSSNKRPSVSSDKSNSSSSANAATPVVWGADTRLSVLVPMTFVFIIFCWHCTWVTSSAYSSPSVVLASRNHDGSQLIIDDFREAYYWLRKNTHPEAKIMSWWDYGYQIAGFSNRTVLVDNNTWNNTHIATVGKAMSVGEAESYEVMKRLDVDYVLIIFGGALGYSGDDINKFLWMVRIAEGVFPNDVKERLFFTERGEYRIDSEATPTMRNSLMYKACYYRFGDFNIYGGEAGYDRVRGAVVGDRQVKLSVLEEAFTSERWIVRVYKVREPDNLGRSLFEATGFNESKGKKGTGAKRTSKKRTTRRTKKKT